MTFTEILNHFQVKKKTDHSAQCICPAHADKEASLTITDANERVLMYCHAKCSINSILTAAGLTLNDLTNGYVPDRWKQYVERREGRQIEAIYNYVDLTGRYAFTRLRLTGKKFIYGTLTGDRWSYGLGGQKRSTIPAVFTNSLAGLSDAILRGDRVFYVEGEKDAIRLLSAGKTAITCGSCNDWNSACAVLLKGADVVVLADNDEPGMKLARQVAHDLDGVAQAVRIVTPYTDIKGGDVSDFLDAGHTVDDLEKLISESMNSEIMNSEYKNLDQFHLIDEQGRIKGVFDWAIFQYISENHNMFVLGGVPYMYDNGVFRADENGSRLKTLIRECCYSEFIKSTTLKRVYDLFVSAVELQVRSEELNCYPASWINFTNGFYDPVTDQMIQHDPKYKAVNQIPHAYDADVKPEGKAIENWLTFCVPDADDREMLLEFAGYCCTRDVRQQKFLILNGDGGTGKSTLIRLIESMIGMNNLSSISLGELQQRFAAYGLLGKLLNSCADLEVAALEDTSTIKKALGEDSLRGEAKGKDAIPFRSYAKLIFSTNELPLVKAEKTNGFYRRLLILPMNKKPETVRSDLFDQLNQQIDYFIHLSVAALKRMYERGVILESDHSVESVERLRMDSDTVSAFIAEEMHVCKDGRAKRSEMYQRYCAYCADAERQSLTKTNFFKSLRVKGFREQKNSDGIMYFYGISFDDFAVKNAVPDGYVQVDEPLPFM